ncbi:proton glutamate symport protein [Opitutaceae bacterium TAV5]|nr:proton glutamate symport protein [Opitutaceae bacterium TAV5]
MTLRLRPPWKWQSANLIISGLVVGLLFGLLARHFCTTPEATERLHWWLDQLIQPLGKLFIRIIFMIVIPLILSAIVLGIVEMGDIRKLGRVGLKCVLWTFILAGTSVVLGLVLVDTLAPGRHMPESTRLELTARYGGDAAVKIEQGTRESPPLAESILELVPQNPLAEAVNAFAPNYTGGGLIAVMVFSVFVGVALAMVPRERGAALTAVFQGMFDVCMLIIEFAMKLAPIGVACLGFSLTSTLGIGILQSLGAYVGVVILGLTLHQFGTYSLLLALIGRQSPLLFFRRIREVMVTAFSTSSSNATLPVSIRVAEENLGLPRQISRFVLTVGASANQNGTALYEGITVLFLAQVFGIDLTIGQQIVVALMCIMAGFGTAGVPGGSLPLVVGVLVTIGVPGEAIAIILGIDRLLDMCRTTLNVSGDLVCAVLVSRGEADLPEDDDTSNTGSPIPVSATTPPGIATG